MESHLGYRISALVKALGKDLKEREGHTRKLRDALNEGYHIDHVRPLSSFNVIADDGVDWDEFQKCWAIGNLTAIPAEENLAKGAQRTDLDFDVGESEEFEEDELQGSPTVPHPDTSTSDEDAGSD